MPVSVEVGGIGYAVMMATPADLEDYAVGFALGEGLVERAAEVERIDVHRIEGGVALRLWLTTTRNAIARPRPAAGRREQLRPVRDRDRKSTRLNSSH